MQKPQTRASTLSVTLITSCLSLFYFFGLIPINLHLIQLISRIVSARSSIIFRLTLLSLIITAFLVRLGYLVRLGLAEAEVLVAVYVKSKSTTGDTFYSKHYEMLKTCTNFGQLILRKILKNVATRCHILRLKCTNSISAGVLPQTLQLD